MLFRVNAARKGMALTTLESCAHRITTNSGNCVRGNGKLFNLKRTCPSGALKYRHK